MRKLFTYSILSVLVLAGCQVKEIMEKQGALPAQESKPFIAIIEGDSIGNETKTTLDNSGNVLWKQGDQLSIFAGSTVNECYQVTDESDGKTSASLNKIPEGGFIAGTNINNNVAFYPYSSTATIAKNGSNYVISGIELPATQNYVEGSFGNGAFSMAAITSSTEEMNLTFKNVLGGLKLQLKGTATIASITVTGNNDEILCGDAEVTVSTESNPSINLADAAAKTVTLDCGTGVALDSETATSFIIALPPITMTGGFTVVVTDTEGKEMEIKTTRSQTINRSNLLKMPAVMYEGSPALTVLHSFLPDNIGKENITNIVFHVKDNTVTDKQLSASVPVYYGIDGTTINIYTIAGLYDISEVTSLMFYQYWALGNLDLSRTVVNNARSFYGMFRECFSLESIQFGKWNTSMVTNMTVMFAGCRQLRSLDLSFMDTHNVRGGGFFGMFNECWKLSSLDLSSFDTSKATEMSAMFNGCKGLSSLNLKSFNTSNVTQMDIMFQGCEMLIELDLSSFDTHLVTNMSNMFGNCSSLKRLDLSSFNTSSVTNFYGMFGTCLGLESLNLSNFQTANAQTMSFMFGQCQSMKELDVSSFSSESLETAADMFTGCEKMQKLDMGAFDISQADCESICGGMMMSSKSGAIRCLPETRAIMEPIMESWGLAGNVTWMTLSEDIDTYEYHRTPDLYFSSDYSKHETVKKLYSATKGQGINIVLMGDAYSDRMIESGLYDTDMELAADAVFEKEPFASFREYFNIYIVYLVSDNEVLGESTALHGISSGTGILTGYVSANLLSHYVTLATENPDLSRSTEIVVVRGSEGVTGYASFLTFGADGEANDTHFYDCDYGHGYGAICVARGNPAETEEFKVTIEHEMGHAFCMLSDEYVTTAEAISDTYQITEMYNRFGWAQNVDVTSDPSTIRWSRFLSDDRYAEDGVGIFEGGASYSTGVWRPSENSIMNGGTEFNAPSRAAIYRKIHKLAYGRDWQFDYEDFVQWDLKNIGLEKRSVKSNTNTYHPHLNHKPFMKVEKRKIEGGRTEINVIMN